MPQLSPSSGLMIFIFVSLLLVVLMINLQNSIKPLTSLNSKKTLVKTINYFYS